MTVVPIARDANSLIGTLKYNRFTFPPVRKSSGKFEPVYDSSGRVLKYIKGTITVETVVFPGCVDPAVSGVIPRRSAASVIESAINTPLNTTDVALTYLRYALLEPAQELVIEWQGCGGIHLNDFNGTGVRDVNNGPKPQLLKWTPYGNKAANIEWTVEFCFAPCAFSGSGEANSSIAEFTFSIDTNIGFSGLTTRTISGTYEIPLTRKSKFQLNLSAGDTYGFNMLEMQVDILKYFPRMTQFKRTNQSFNLSNDRKTVEFSITDEEIDSDDGYGIGIADQDIKITASSSMEGGGGGFRVWQVSLDGEITLFAGFPKTYAWNEIAWHYNKLFIEKSVLGIYPKKLGKTDYAYDKIPEPAPGQSRSKAILRGARFTDNLYGRSVSFSYNWQLFCDPRYIFTATGMFQPLEGTWNEREKTWREWVVSLDQINGLD